MNEELKLLWKFKKKKILFGGGVGSVGGGGVRGAGWGGVRVDVTEK